MKYFKKCNMCGKAWKTKEDFLKDRELNFIGEWKDVNMLSYNHKCKTTLTIKKEGI